MRVLVVEDEAKLAALLTRGLEEVGYAVDHTASGIEAVWLAEEHAYDVILLDLGLDDLDGLEVCRRLRARKRWSPIIAVTARDGVGDRVAVLDAGADDYLIKPFSFEELLARLRAMVRRGTEPRPAVLEVGDIHLDPASRHVARAGVEITLTGKEFALLEVFLRSPGRVLTRAEILAHVWDFAFEGDPRIVDVYVRYLRRKLDEPFGAASIETVRGVGYRLAEAR